MQDEPQPEVKNASEAKRRARANLQKDRDRWKSITPIVTKLRALRAEDQLSQSMAEEWRHRR